MQRLQGRGTTPGRMLIRFECLPEEPQGSVRTSSNRLLTKRVEIGDVIDQVYRHSRPEGHGGCLPIALRSLGFRYAFQGGGSDFGQG